MTKTSQTGLDENVGAELLDGGIDNTSIEIEENAFMNSLALFYLQMQAKMLLLVACVIQKLLKELQEVHG